MELRRGTPDDRDALAAMLARSYSTCPVWGWMLPPTSRRRPERMERFFAALTGIYLDESESRVCLTTADRAGAVLLDAPGEWKMGAADSARLFTAMAPAFGRSLPRAVRAFSAFDAGHPVEPHYYLSVLGVEPAARRRGVADALLEEVLARSRGDGAPVHVDTGRPASRDYYLRNGFEVAGEAPLGGGSVTVWFLSRPPDGMSTATQAADSAVSPATTPIAPG